MGTTSWSPRDKNVNPLQLTGLKQAIFVLKCMEDGMKESENVELFQGDKQLVDIWKNFLIHNEWINQADSKWEVTDKGKEAMGKYTI